MTKCPNCGWKPEDDFEPTTADEFNKESGISEFTTFMNKTIKRVAERMKVKLGYGIPDKKEELVYSDPENLGSCITGEWRQNDNQKDN